MNGFFFKLSCRMSFGEKVAALDKYKKTPEFIENTEGKLGYMGVESKGENKIEFQKIGPAVPKGSFIRLAAEPDGNCFFSSLLLSIRKPMIGYTVEGKIEFTTLFREWYMTPERIQMLKEKATSFIESVSSENMKEAQKSIIEDAFEGVEKDKEYTDILLAMLISEDIAPGYTAIFLNATNGDPKVPTIPKEQCMYNVQDENEVVIFMYYGNHFEPIFFLREDGTRKSIFNRNDPELKPILAMLEEACKRDVPVEENAELAAALAASLEQGQEDEELAAAMAASLVKDEGVEEEEEVEEVVGEGGEEGEGEGEEEEEEEEEVQVLEETVGGGGSAAAPAEAATIPEKAQEVEAIVVSFVEKHKATWAKAALARNLKSFIQDDDKETTGGHLLQEELKNPDIHMDGFLVKDCRGINNDCIVNSLLTCLSPTFRRLEGEFKDKVASYYRYEHLLPMYRLFIKGQALTKEAKAKAKSIEEEIRSGKDAYTADKAKVLTEGYGGRPISAEVAAAFGITHGINVLIKESDAREQGAFTLLGPRPEAPSFIIIHNTHGIHYSSISDSADNYFFPLSMIKTWIDKTEQRQLKLNKTKCPFITNQVLRGHGKLFIVVNAENTDDNTRCKNVYIRELDGGDVNEYKKDIRNILLIKKVFIPPRFGNPDKPGYKIDVEQAKMAEWEGAKAGAQRALDTLKTRYPVFNKEYTSWEDVDADTATLPFINILGKEGFTLANPDVHDTDGTPSTYVEFMAAIKELENSAAASKGGGSQRKSRFRKTRKKLSHPV